MALSLSTCIEHGGDVLGINLNKLTGCLCEIKDYDNELIALGRISAASDSEGSSIDIVSNDGNDLPSMVYGTPVRINVFSSKHSYIGLEGYVYIAHNSFWRLSNVSCFGENERRAYFRLKTRSKAEVERVFESSEPGEEPVVVSFPCIVTSVSISGALIAVDDDQCFFPVGTTLVIKNLKIGETSQIFNLRCCVRRTDLNPKLGRLFGCEFVGMGKKEVERLCQTIFAQQRIEIQRRRGIL